MAVLATSLTSNIVFAQPSAEAAPAASTPDKSAPTPDKLDEARKRYDRALELSDEGNYDEALLELQRAYALAPTYRLLYNLGVVSVAVHDYVKAIDYFNRYLIQGGTEVEPARATEVETQIDRLRTRVARLRISTTVANAQVSIDDIPVGKSPIDNPITLNAGRHRVTASAPGYFPATSVVELVGNDIKSVTLSLQIVTADKPSRPLPWLAYGVTAVLGGASIVTGVLALTTESSYDNKVNTLGVSGSDVSSSYEKMRVLSVTTDVLLGATIIAAGVSVYLTVKPIKTKSQSTGIRILPTGAIVF
jgi:hypothetical protein